MRFDSLLTKRCQEYERTLAFGADKEKAMSKTRTSPGAMTWPGGAAVPAEIGLVGLWRRFGEALRRLWASLITRPYRGGATTPDELPPEYFRYPRF
jgi:hypothetical protein